MSLRHGSSQNCALGCVSPPSSVFFVDGGGGGFLTVLLGRYSSVAQFQETELAGFNVVDDVLAAIKLSKDVWEKVQQHGASPSPSSWRSTMSTACGRR